MQIITFDEFVAEIETTFSAFADTNSIDRISIKTWMIECLRKFGKNICEKREAVATVKNSRALLPEGFKSLHMALRLTPHETGEKKSNKTLLVEKQKIENPAYWSDATMDYFANYCESKITTEKIYLYNEPEDKCHNYQWLSLVQSIQKDTIAADCLNLHPSIRNTYPDKISITNRTMNTNFKEGEVYIQYNSLPVGEDGEIAIPIYSTGDIKRYIENYIKIKLVESLAINSKSDLSLNQFISLWMQQDRQYYILAKSETNWNNLDVEKWSKNVYKQNRQNQARFNLPK